MPTAVAGTVLVGALVVGDSVRGSLRAAFTERLGTADFAVLPVHSFPDLPETGLAARLAGDSGFTRYFLDPAPLYRLDGTAFRPGGHPAPVTVFGVDERFFRFHGVSGALAAGSVRISPGLRRAGLEPGEPILIRVGEPAAIAPASFFGDKEDSAVTLRRTVEPWPDPGPGPASGSFSLFPGQGPVRAVFVPLDDLRRALEEPAAGAPPAGSPPRANALLVRTRSDAAGDPAEFEAALSEAVARASGLDERGLGLRPAPAGGLVLESRSLVLSDGVLEGALAAGQRLALSAAPVLTYLATAIRTPNGGETPYSLVAGLPEDALPAVPGSADGMDRIVPGGWLAGDLGLAPGDPVEMDFLLWDEDGRFHGSTARFRAGASVPLDGVFADPTLSPEFPGVSDSARIGDWDPPFPVDLSRIRERDERYWDEWRTLPKAFLPFETARRLFAMRQGSATSVRFEGEDRAALAAALREALPPADFGLVPVPVRRQGLEASRGATDFGTYFLYFSWFLLVSAFVLLGLLYRLGIERRLSQVGLLLACGWTPRLVARVLLLEAAVVAAVGIAAGAVGGWGYASVMIGLLSGVWEGAVAGTLPASGASGAALRVFVTPASVALGAVGGFAIALSAAWWTTRGLVRRSPRALLTGSSPEEDADRVRLGTARGPAGRAASRLAVLALLVAAALLGAAVLDLVPDTGGFFGAGGALLAAALFFAWGRLRHAAKSARFEAAPSAGSAGTPVVRGLRGLAFRAAAFRPGRSLAAMALIAFAAFTLVAVESFRKSPDPARLPPGAGGFVALAETTFGIPWNPEDPEGREALNLPADLGGFAIRPLRVAGDEDASCLNLYRPARPRVVGIPRRLAEENRFPFAAHLGDTPAEIENPWRLLWSERTSEAPVPVIGDQNSMTYVLKWPVGEEREFPIGKGGAPVRLRLVGTLWDSVLAGELLMAEEDLLARLPARDGYRLFLVDREEPPGSAEELAAAESAAARLLDEALGDFGAVATPTRARLDEFHRVENTYLSTFQALGGFGLLLGVFGLGAVLFRAADERRQEWALLAASGYRRGDFLALGFWENALLLVSGLLSGTAAALLAILPVLGQREGGGSLGLLAFLLLGVLGLGLLAGALAARVAANRPILASLRAE